jgi:hypothetical protein
MKLVRLELARISIVGEIVRSSRQGRLPATSTIEDPRGFVAALAQSIHGEAVAGMPVGEVLTTG